MNIQSVAYRLVELCREGKYRQAQPDLYANSAVSIEPEGFNGKVLKDWKHFMPK